MRLFKVPYDMKHEEKIFGGYLSLRQVVYIMFAASSLSILLLPINIVIKLIIIGIISSLFLLCAFLKVGGINFDKFFFYALKYLTRKKTYLYERSAKW